MTTILRATVLALGVLAAPLAALAQSAPSLPKGTVVEYRAGETANRDLALIISGDGGWADLDRQVGNRLVARGTSVVGFDAMKYFNDTRSPDQTARDVDATLAYYLKAWDKDRIVLVGFSFGASVMPFVLNRMPEPLKSKVALTALLAPGTYANWEIHWGDWLHDKPHDSALQLAPEMSKLSGVKLLCVYGADEAASSLCPTLPAAAAEILKLPGGHHFDENYPSLADQILRRVPQ